MNNLAVEVTNIVNKYIDEKGLTTEQVCGVLDVVSFKVKQASFFVEDEPESGCLAMPSTGSPVSKEN
jgi:hypothetical protein